MQGIENYVTFSNQTKFDMMLILVLKIKKWFLL